jgi:DNA-binding transcriptional ArsR family regulator
VKIDPSEVFKALSVGTRIRIIQLLKAGGPLGSKKIAAALGITPAAVSQHLRALRQAGLVRGERKGYWVPYSIDVRGMEDCCCMVEEVCKHGCYDSARKSPRTRVVGLRAVAGREQKLDELAGRERQLSEELKAVRRMIAELKKRDK